MNFNKKAFTLIEVLVSILISSIIIIAGFNAYTMILAGKVRLIERTRLQKEALFFTERLFQTIKEGGTIDYEEYFNRKLVGTGILNGHYEKNTGFGNFGFGGNPGVSPLSSLANYGEEFYYCRSGNGGSKMMSATGGCYNDSELNSSLKLQVGQPQRYGEYSFQFIDYNIDHDDDLGDQDGNSNIIGDDDDENLGNGVEVFGSGENVKELYLISGNKKQRTFFRYNFKKDSRSPSTDLCKPDGTEKSGCIGTIEFLKLEGKDLGMDHKDLSVSDSRENDGVIDTWVVDKRFSGKNDEIAASISTESYWKPLFPENINVSDFKIYIYPNKDQSRVWQLSGKELKSTRISPYAILSIEIKPSWEIRSKIRGDVKPIRFNTTINLTEIFSK